MNLCLRVGAWWRERSRTYPALGGSTLTEPILTITGIERVAGEHTSELRVAYAVTNPTRRPMFIANRVEGRPGLLHPPSHPGSTEIAALVYAGEDTALFLLGASAAPGTDPGPRVVPRASMVPKGAMTRAVIRAPLPLTEGYPHDAGAAGARVEPTAIFRIRLRLYYAIDSDFPQVPRESPDLPGAYEIGDLGVRAVERVAVLPEPCTLLRREDDFRRAI